MHLCGVCQFMCYHCYVFVYIVCMHMHTHMCIVYTCVMYCIAENVAGENIGELSCLVCLEEKTLANMGYK